MASGIHIVIICNVILVATNGINDTMIQVKGVTICVENVKMGVDRGFRRLITKCRLHVTGVHWLKLPECRRSVIFELHKLYLVRVQRDDNVF